MPKTLQITSPRIDILKASFYRSSLPGKLRCFGIFSGVVNNLTRTNCTPIQISLLSFLQDIITNISAPAYIELATQLIQNIIADYDRRSYKTSKQSEDSLELLEVLQNNNNPKWTLEFKLLRINYFLNEYDPVFGTHNVGKRMYNTIVNCVQQLQDYQKSTQQELQKLQEQLQQHLQETLPKDIIKICQSYIKP